MGCSSLVNFFISVIFFIKIAVFKVHFKIDVTMPADASFSVILGIVAGIHFIYPSQW